MTERMTEHSKVGSIALPTFATCAAVPAMIRSALRVQVLSTARLMVVAAWTRWSPVTRPMP